MASASLQELFSRYPSKVWVGRRGQAQGPTLPTGYSALDEAIGGGWPVGSLVEILTFGPGLGRSSLLLPAIATLTKAGKGVAWLPLKYEQPYAPALVMAGIDIKHILVTASDDQVERLWAAEQCLQSGTCGAVVLTEQERQIIPDALLRRLKLAAEATGSTVFVLRREERGRLPSPATLRIRVRSKPFGEIRFLSILKCGSHPPRSLTLDLDAHG